MASRPWVPHPVPLHCFPLAEKEGQSALRNGNEIASIFFAGTSAVVANERVASPLHHVPTAGLHADLVPAPALTVVSKERGKHMNEDIH